MPADPLEGGVLPSEYSPTFCAHQLRANSHPTASEFSYSPPIKIWTRLSKRPCPYAAPKWRSRPSLWLVWKKAPELLPASRLLSRMTLTTPAMAPEPYAADAPPVTVSMRETRTCGTRFKSKLSPWLLFTRRCPLSSTSVRLPKYGFRPRRSAMNEPVKKFELPVFAGVNVETLDGANVAA